MKSTVFTMFSAHPGSGSECHFQPQITNKSTLEPILQFSANKSGKITKLIPNRVPRGPPNPSRNHTNPDLDPKVSCQVSPWTPGSPKWCPRYPEWSLKVFKITIVGIKSVPFQQSTCQQLPVDRGAGGRGEALRYSPHTLRGSRACANVSSDSQVRFSDSEATGTQPLPPAPPKSNPKSNLKSDPEKAVRK